MYQKAFSRMGILIMLLLGVFFYAAGVSLLFSAGPVIERPTREEVRSQLRPAARGGGLASPSLAAQDAFRVHYQLSEDADLSVTLADFRWMPIRTFHVAAGEEGAQAGDNVLSVWDGKDSQNNEAPVGLYSAALSFRYADGRVEVKRFRLEKK